MVKQMLSQRDITEGYGLGKWKVWQLVKEGQLTPLRVPGGRAVKFARAEVEGLFQAVER